MRFNLVLKVAFVFLMLSMFSNKIIAQQKLISDINENLIVISDRDIYFSGENIYFSVFYNLSTTSDIEDNSLLSKIVYVELIDCNNGSAQAQKKLSITDFNANGIITIPKEITTGNYLLRAYTRYQQNFSELNFGNHILTIINPKSASETMASWLDSDSVWIVPEGNKLIDLVKNKVIIRIPDTLANSNNKYYITDQNNNRITLESPSSLNVLVAEQIFNLVNTYTFIIETPEGNTISKSFPLVQSAGFQTNIDKSGGIISYIIQNKSTDSEKKNYQVCVYANDFRKIYSKPVNLDNSTNYVSLSETIFNKGINYITLENQDSIIENINSLYFGYEKPTNYPIQLNKDRIKTRQQVNIPFIKPNSAQTNNLTFSVSVAKKGSILNNDSFKPSFYLSHPLLVDNYIKNNILTNEDINHIMVLYDKTLKKEMFIQTNISDSSIIEYYPETRGLTISGIVQNKKTKEPVANIDVYLSVLYNNPQLHIYKTNEKGEFVFTLNQLTGINDIFISPITDVNDDYDVLVKSSYSHKKPELNRTPMLFSLADKKSIEDLYVNFQLQQKFCPANEIHEKNRVKSQQFNINESKITYLMKDYIQFESFEEIFIEIITNAKIVKSGGQLSFNVYDKNSRILPGKPLVLVDYLPVFDFNKLLALHVSQIEKIEVIDNTYILGPNVINGIILITTNSDNFGEIDFPKSSVFMEYATIDKQPAYKDFMDSCTDLSLNMPDFRTTLYWNPNLLLNNDNSTINFVTSDSKGVYEIIVKGISSDGKLYFGKKEFTVE